MIESQNIGNDVNPKSVLCVHFKKNQCTKGDKCKFSHDLNIERKSEKRIIYESETLENNDKCHDWDQAKFAEIVNKKHGAANMKIPTTIVRFIHFMNFLSNI